ncbi:MAG: hypothetical protein JWN70_1937 [Planctomycetaceae bacterium]|nr:hypothetical protein [Planctomycetaceae bacterium]
MLRAFMSHVCFGAVRLSPIAVAMLLSAVSLSGAGCAAKKPSAPPPKTFPVTGKVVTKDGKPVAGGMVEFQSKTNNQLSVTSEIKPDGTFSLISRRDGEQFPGATEGDYQVTLFPPMSASQTESPKTLPETFKVEPKENAITLTVPGSKP